MPYLIIPTMVGSTRPRRWAVARHFSPKRAER